MKRIIILFFIILSGCKSSVNSEAEYNSFKGETSTVSIFYDAKSARLALNSINVYVDSQFTGKDIYPNATVSTPVALGSRKVSIRTFPSIWDDHSIKIDVESNRDYYLHFKVKGYDVLNGTVLPTWEFITVNEETFRELSKKGERRIEEERRKKIEEANKDKDIHGY